MNELKLWGHDDILFEWADQGRLTCRLADGSRVEDVHCVVLFPFSDPGRYISVVTREKGNVNELGILASISEFPAAQAEIIQAAVEHRYFFPEIMKVNQIIDAYGLHEWDVLTDRGTKVFFVHDIRENVTVEANGAVVITDVENCRYKISDLSGLPHASRARIERILP